MFSQNFVLTRSKSDNQINKSKVLVLSPTPIKEQCIGFLDQLTRLNSFQSRLEALEREEPESHFNIRKYQSVGTLNMEQRMLERLAAGEIQSIINAEVEDQTLQSSSYHMPEIPVRASNPVVRDQKFRESDDEDSDLNSSNDIAEIHPAMDANHPALYNNLAFVQN